MAELQIATEDAKKIQSLEPEPIATDEGLGANYIQDNLENDMKEEHKKSIKESLGKSICLFCERNNKAIRQKISDIEKAFECAEYKQE